MDESSKRARATKVAVFSQNVLRGIFYLSASIAACTYVVSNGAKFFEEFVRLKTTASYAISGPSYTQKIIKTEIDGVRDGGKGSYWKFKTICLNPQNGGTLVPGSAQFITDRRTADQARAYWKEEKTADPLYSYCVTLATGTGASEVQTFIYGYIQGTESVPQTLDNK